MKTQHWLTGFTEPTWARNVTNKCKFDVQGAETV